MFAGVLAYKYCHSLFSFIGYTYYIQYVIFKYIYYIIMFLCIICIILYIFILIFARIITHTFEIKYMHLLYLSVCPCIKSCVLNRVRVRIIRAI